MSIFLKIPKDEIILESDSFFVVKDKYPVSQNHLLIISKRIVNDFFSLNEEEQKELTDIINKSKIYIEQIDYPDGFNIGMNCGEAAGQTIMHFHCHLIPRYIGDVDNPSGGVRHCIMGKGYYNLNS